jgi:hypothetical protein
MGFTIGGNWLILAKAVIYFRSAAIRCETSTQAARSAPLESNGMPNAAPAAADAIVVHLDVSEPSGSENCTSVAGSSESLCGISSLFCTTSSLGGGPK